MYTALRVASHVDYRLVPVKSKVETPRQIPEKPGRGLGNPRTGKD